MIKQPNCKYKNKNLNSNLKVIKILLINKKI